MSIETSIHLILRRSMIGLENTGALFGLHVFFQTGQNSFNEGCKGQDHEDLNDIKNNPIDHIGYSVRHWQCLNNKLASEESLKSRHKKSP